MMDRLQFMRDERNKLINTLPASHRDDAHEAFDHYLVGSLSELIQDDNAWKSAVQSACNCVDGDSKRRQKAEA
jgi:hypothetical protein